MSAWDLLITDARIATMRADSDAYGVIEDGAIGVRNGLIDWVGPAAERHGRSADRIVDAGGRWLTPALIDCHTHLVFGGDRSAEFEQRLAGASYADIAKSGGGIMSTVRATREASPELLLEAAAARLEALVREGVATVEIKSGYGLDCDTEMRMLRVARSLHGRTNIVTTFLGAHALPTDFDGDADDYIGFVVDQVMPAVHERKLADAVDAFCESIAFSPKQVARVFEKAAALGLPVKLHADQLGDSGAAALAAQHGALSADHLEYASEAGVRAMAECGTVAVLLPGAFVTLRETRLPPVAALRRHGVPIAVASDCNPGSSPISSLHINMSLACSQFGLTPEECFAGVTRVAARALGLDTDRGTLEIGKRADLAIWDFDHPRQLCYWMGLNPLHRLIVGGKI